MPETAREWVVFMVGLCAVGVLLALLISERKSSSAPATAGSTGLSAPVRTQSVPTETPTSTEPSANSAGRPAVRLVVNASRGDSWLMVRSASATGPLLYQGILTKGRSVRLVGRRLWVRVGAGANLDARVNGRALKLLAGTFTGLLTPSGLVAP